MTRNVINALHSKKRFVESLSISSKYEDNDNFLTPTRTKEKSQPRARVPKKQTNSSQRLKKASPNLKNEVQLTEKEYNRIISLLESKQQKSKKRKKSVEEQQNIPVWAKLAYASSNPNNRHQSNKDYY